MLIEFEEAILQRLKEKGLTNVQGWSGKAEELFMKPKTYPAVRYVFEGLDLQETLAPNIYNSIIRGSLIVFFQSLKEKGQGAYPILENILNALMWQELNGYMVEIKKIELLFHESIDFAYQVRLEAYGKYIVPFEEKEILTTRITTYEGEELSTDVKKEG